MLATDEFWLYRAGSDSCVGSFSAWPVGVWTTIGNGGTAGDPGCVWLGRTSGRTSSNRTGNLGVQG